MALAGRKWALRLAGAGLLFIIVIVLAVLFVPRALGFGQAPQQPIAFSHIPHVSKDVAGLQCVFCHRTVEREAVASIPSVEQCMFCHRVIGKDNPEVQKLVAAWEAKQPIQWMRVHRVPDSVHFVHEAHIRSGITCATCHGDVASMAQVRQARMLRMGDCLACHRERGAPTECSVCHY